MQAEGTKLWCNECGATWEMDTLSRLHGVNTDKGFSHIPDWYAWERACVREALENGTYCLDIPVEIRMQVDMRAVYRVGTGRLHHDKDGFHLVGCADAAGQPQLDYRQKPLASYSLYSDYYWYEIGDMICIGDTNTLYY